MCFLSGCAHQINITPNTAAIENIQNSSKIQKTAGYYISASMKEREVITPGGGGDRVKYRPYKNIEYGFAKVLDNAFLETKALNSDAALNLNNNSADYVVSLDIKTDSSSASMFTWPPTWFEVSITAEILNTRSNEKMSVSAKGEGAATYSEFIFDKGIAGKKAALNALARLQDSLLNAPELRKNQFYNPSSPTTQSPGKSYAIDDFPIRAYNFDSKMRRGSIVVDIGDKGFQARLWVVKNIGIICASKNIAMESGNENFHGARYTILDESIQSGLLTIDFEATY